MRNDFASHFGQGEGAASAAAGNGFLGHAEDHATGLVLGNGGAAHLAHLKQAARSVVAHAGQDDAHGIAPGSLGNRAKQHIDRWAVARNVRPLLDGNSIPRTIADQQHMQIARGNEDLAGLHQIAILGFLDPDRAAHVEATGKGGGESLRHVLDDQDGWGVRGQGFEHFAQCFGTAG